MENSTKQKIQVGFILEIITNSFYATKRINDIQKEKIGLGKRDISIHLKKGEKIEIRFPFEWNYRTEDNLYFNSNEEYILANCKLIGKVKEEIKFQNKANLEEILRIGLYEKEL